MNLYPSRLRYFTRFLCSSFRKPFTKKQCDQFHLPWERHEPSYIQFRDNIQFPDLVNLRGTTSQFLPFGYKQSDFRFDRSVMKGTLLRKERTFTSASPLPFGAFSGHFAFRTHLERATDEVRLVVIGRL